MRASSKEQAARRAGEALEAAWRPLIEQALAWREGDPELPIGRVLGLIKYTVEVGGGA